MDVLIGLLFVILGVIVGALVSILPSVHIYNIAPIFILIAPSLGIPSSCLLFFLLGNVIGFAVINAISTIFFSAPDDTTFIVLLPAQTMLINGRGFEAAIMMGAGALIGASVLVALSPLLVLIIPVVLRVVNPHLHWILALFLFYILFSEFPKDFGIGKSKWARFKAAWRTLAAGYLTFILASVYGFIIMYGNIMPVESAYFGMLPAFIGLFAISSLIMNIFSRPKVPKQNIQRSLDATKLDLIKGGLAGISGGLFAAIVPALTGGMGSIIAGQATGQRDEAQFIISIGASRFVYYVGAFFFLFMPGFSIVRGGLANIAATVYIPQRYSEYFVAVAGIAIGSVLAFGILVLISYFLANNIHRVRYDYLSIAIIILLSVIVYSTTGLMGLFVMVVGTAIGLIPLIYGSRRLHCMAVIIFPLMLSMAGLADEFALLLGLPI